MRGSDIEALVRQVRSGGPFERTRATLTLVNSLRGMSPQQRRDLLRDVGNSDSDQLAAFVSERSGGQVSTGDVNLFLSNVNQMDDNEIDQFLEDMASPNASIGDRVQMGLAKIRRLQTGEDDVSPEVFTAAAATGAAASTLTSRRQKVNRERSAQEDARERLRQEREREQLANVRAVPTTPIGTAPSLGSGSWYVGRTSSRRLVRGDARHSNMLVTSPSLQERNMFLLSFLLQQSKQALKFVVLDVHGDLASVADAPSVKQYVSGANESAHALFETFASPSPQPVAVIVDDIGAVIDAASLMDFDGLFDKMPKNVAFVFGADPSSVIPQGLVDVSAHVYKRDNLFVLEDGSGREAQFGPFAISDGDIRNFVGNRKVTEVASTEDSDGTLPDVELPKSDSDMPQWKLRSQRQKSVLRGEFDVDVPAAFRGLQHERDRRFVASALTQRGIDPDLLEGFVDARHISRLKVRASR